MFWVFTVHANESVPGQAEQTFARFGSSIYQVRIINVKSHNLNSSGSGFFVADGNIFVTNYHVVSSVVLDPNEFKIVIELGAGEVELDVLAIDVVNDLALLQVPVTGEALALREKTPAKGEKMYSVGNPHNIGMTIVEGNYNGLAEDYVFDRIHFSGAINPGMSGGPTIDGEGRVVGINVQTGGNQVGFLVPVEKLANLLETIPSREAVSLLGSVLAVEQESTAEQVSTSVRPSTVGDSTAVGASASSGNEEVRAAHYRELQRTIGEQISTATSSLIEEINAQPWPYEELAGARVVGKIHDGFMCWGNSDTDEKKHLSSVVKGCNSRQSIYVSPELNSGYFEYEFRLLQAEEWPSVAFYQYATQEFSHGRPSNNAGEEDVGNFTCVNDIVEREEDGLRRKAAYCTRPYKKYRGLYDSFYMAVTVDRDKKALMEHFCLSGVTQEKNQHFLEKFISKAAWQ